MVSIWKLLKSDALVLAAWRHLIELVLEDARFNALVAGPDILSHFEIELSELVQTGFATDSSNWSTSGSALVTSVEAVAADHLRLQLSAALGAQETVQIGPGLTDLAGNSTLAAQAVDPVE